MATDQYEQINSTGQDDFPLASEKIIWPLAAFANRASAGANECYVNRFPLVQIPSEQIQESPDLIGQAAKQLM